MTFSAMFLCFDFLSFFLFFDHMGWGIFSSPTSDQTWALATKAWSPKCWTTKSSHCFVFLKGILYFYY